MKTPDNSGSCRKARGVLSPDVTRLIRYNQPRIVETFFNLLWVAVAATLFGVWLAGARPQKHSPLPSVGLQLIALALLVVILLPVISLTDDLQANTNPAETEHFSRRVDVAPSAGRDLHSLPLALALLVAAPAVARTWVVGSVRPDRLISSQIGDWSLARANRPPPLLKQFG